MSDCGHDTQQDGEWPSDNDRTVCYGCFAEEADRLWWEMLPVALTIAEVDIALARGDTREDTE